MFKDFSSILQYGATGLSAILFYFSYLLLKVQNNKDKPDTSMLKAIKSYMYISIVLALISLISTFIQVPKSSVPSHINTKYNVKGVIKKSDSASPADVSIIKGYPIYKVPSNGEITGFEVWKNPDGQLPTLALSSNGYYTSGIDLNDDSKVRINGNKVEIIKPIILTKEIEE